MIESKRLFVLAGGFGTRLKGAIRDSPKALAPINGVPFLRIQLEHWIGQGLRKFSFLLHHKAEAIVAFLHSHQSGLLKGCSVDWIIEPVPMDTGGAIANAVRDLRLQGNFLVTNADTWLGTGMVELMDSPPPSMAIVNLPDVSRYGQVVFDQDLYITQFAEKGELSTSGWINAGIFHLDTSFFKRWNGQSFSLERELFVSLVQERKLKAVPLTTEFLDIGIPEDYHRFCRWVEGGRKTPL